MLKNLENIEDIRVSLNADLSKLSTLRLKAQGDLIEVFSVDALKKVIKELSDYRVLGLGANQILPSNSSVPYLKIKLPFDKTILDTVKNSYTLPGSVSLGTLTAAAIKHGLKGWEVFTGVPATIAGAVAMNAGTGLGEISQVVTQVDVVTKNGDTKTYEVSEKDFSYRQQKFLSPGDVIYQVTLTHKGIDQEVKKIIKDYMKMRNTTQPLWDKTCGCIFKNYDQRCRAGTFIDLCNLKGLSVSGVQVSHLHGNFFINKGEASDQDFKKIIKIVQDELYLQYGIKFQLEVKL